MYKLQLAAAANTGTIPLCCPGQRQHPTSVQALADCCCESQTPSPHTASDRDIHSAHVQTLASCCPSPLPVTETTFQPGSTFSLPAAMRHGHLLHLCQASVEVKALGQAITSQGRSAPLPLSVVRGRGSQLSASNDPSTNAF